VHRRFTFHLPGRDAANGMVVNSWIQRFSWLSRMAPRVADMSQLSAEYQVLCGCFLPRLRAALAAPALRTLRSG
jgi:hypothetical protein